ncbi:MAG: hypothetical protein SF097_26750 [Acidobacteriota bacterium]|nr:hypothetical protein [Acidobacteriota bacterium]
MSSVSIQAFAAIVNKPDSDNTCPSLARLASLIGVIGALDVWLSARSAGGIPHQ